MSGANPVETKMETAAKVGGVVDAAASLAGPTPPVAAAAKAGWWALRNPKRFGIVAGSTALALAAGTFGWKYLANSSSPSARAQDNKTVVAQGKPDEFIKPALAPTKNDDVNPLLLDLPSVPTPKSDRVELELPAIAPPRPGPRPTETEPPLILPPAPRLEPKKPGEDPDNLFKAPDLLPSTITDRKDKPVTKETIPIIRIGATGDVTPPPPPKKPMVDAPPSILDVPIPKISDVPAPPLPMTPKIDDLPPIVGSPSIGPSPEIKTPPLGTPMKEKLPDPPPLIKIDEPPIIKNPMIPDFPMTLTPPINPAKKDMYDEDWHAQRDGDTYAIISKEYYKTVDYSAALEAYNKERKKSGERIVRVPPTWVLEEQFPNLVGTKPEKLGVLEARPTGNPKFEPVAAKTSGERPAPLPLPASSSDEYKVKVEAGETIRDIARKVYGDPNAWKKLYDLNPTLDPTQPIPSGTTLRLGK